VQNSEDRGRDFLVLIFCDHALASQKRDYLYMDVWCVQPVVEYNYIILTSRSKLITYMISHLPVQISFLIILFCHA
jgi:hypothetical protein